MIAMLPASSVSSSNTIRRPSGARVQLPGIPIDVSDLAQVVAVRADGVDLGAAAGVGRECDQAVAVRVGCARSRRDSERRDQHHPDRGSDVRHAPRGAALRGRYASNGHRISPFEIPPIAAGSDFRFGLTGYAGRNEVTPSSGRAHAIHSPRSQHTPSRRSRARGSRRLPRDRMATTPMAAGQTPHRRRATPSRRGRARASGRGHRARSASTSGSGGPSPGSR